MDLPMRDAEAHTESSSSSTPATEDTAMTALEQDTKTPCTPSSPPAELSRNQWSKRHPLSAHDAILYPLVETKLPAPKEGAPIFLPPDADRTWYMGFIESWKDFNARAIKFWNNPDTRNAFYEVAGQPMDPPRVKDVDMTCDSHGSEILTSWFERNVLEVVVDIANKLIQTTTMQAAGTSLQGVLLGDPAEDDLGNNECAWDPTFVARAVLGSGDLETRCLGQAEYLAGKKGALAWAIEEATANSWGSLRCVLGKSISIDVGLRVILTFVQQAT